MNLTQSLRLGFALLIGVHLMMAFGAVALLARMRPAIERIVSDNVYSLEAAEEMLSVLAAAEGDVSDEERVRYRAAYARAAANITDPREIALIESLGRDSEGALAGRRAERQRSAEQLRQLANVNREDIVRTDRSAQQLGTAGAWAVVFLALVTLIGALVGLRRLDHRVLHPIEELYGVVGKVRQGDAHRRCRPGLGAASELGEVMQTVNDLLDEQFRHHLPRPSPDGDAERAALLHLLDQLTEPTLVLDREGRVVAANTVGLETLAAREGLRERLGAQIRGGQGEGEELAITPLADGRRFLVALPSEPSRV